MIDWLKPRELITPNFCVKDACYLPTWDKLHAPTEVERVNLTRLCWLMEKVRLVVGKPVVVHCMIRPVEYNKIIGGASKSAHLLGLACDFSVPGIHCDKVRTMLLPHLEAWQARMEDKPGSSWVHIDLAPVTISRFFKP